MLKWLCAVALALSVASPVLAQKTRLADRPLKQIKDFDPTPIKEGLQAIRRDGECSVQYVVARTGKANRITADCSVPEMAPYVTRSVENAEWEAEIIGGHVLDSYARRQPFKFGIATAPDPRGEKAPVLTRPVDNKEIERAIAEVGGEVERCDATFTVGIDGKPRNVTTNCKPAALDPFIAKILGKVQYTPAEKEGRPTDWPGISMTLLFVELG